MTKIERLVHFGLAQVYDPQDTSGDNNTWIYRRAPDGYLFQLIELTISAVQRDSLHTGVVAVYDGHEYTHWNIFPGVQSMEMLGRTEHNSTIMNSAINLHGWECKEYTLGLRSLTESYGFKACMIMFFYLKKASRLELMEYAVKHPKNQDMFRHALRGTTVEPTE